MTAPLDNGVPSQRGASRDIAGAAGMWIMAGVAQQEACTTRLAGKEPRFVSGDQRGVLMHRRCVLVSLCPCVLQMDGTDTGFRPKVQCFLALGWRLGLAGYVVECDSMPRKESREKELGPCGRDDGSLPCGGVQTISGSVEWLSMRSGRNWTGWRAGVEHPTSQGQGPGVDFRGKGVLIGDRWCAKEGGCRSVGGFSYCTMARSSMAALASPLSQAESMRREWTD